MHEKLTVVRHESEYYLSIECNLTLRISVYFWLIPFLNVIVYRVQILFYRWYLYELCLNSDVADNDCANFYISPILIITITKLVALDSFI